MNPSTRVLFNGAKIFCLLIIFYSLSYTGTPISDDEQLFASGARNLALSGKLSAEQLYGNLRIKGDYHGVEPGYSALASLWYRLFLHSGFGHLQSLYILPILYTGLSAALILLIAYQLGYSNSVGIVAALLYGLSTMAWPYSKTLFREPLISFLLLCCLAVFLYAIGRRNRLVIVFIAFLLLCLLVLLTLTKVTMGVAGIGLFITYLLVQAPFKGNKRKIIIFGCLMIGVCLILGSITYIFSLRASDSDVFYRFSGALIRDAYNRLVSMPHSHLMEALFAPLISPWKGLFFYSPICLLGVASCFVYFRRSPELFILPIVVLITLLFSQALAYDDQWWTPTWGSRFLLPAIPLMIISALPIIDKFIGLGRKGWFLLAGLFLLGFIIQLPGVLSNSAEFTSSVLRNISPENYSVVIWDFTRMPIARQWSMVFSEDPDILIWRAITLNPIPVISTIFLGLAWLVGEGVFGFRLWPNSQLGRNFFGFRIIFIAFSSISTIFLLLIIGKSDPIYQLDYMESMCNELRDLIKPNDIVIVQPYPSSIWLFFMNNECGQGRWYSLPYNGEIADNPQARQLTDDLFSNAVLFQSRFWIIEQYWSDTFLYKEKLLDSNDRYLLYHEDFPGRDSNVFLGLYVPK